MIVASSISPLNIPHDITMSIFSLIPYEDIRLKVIFVCKNFFEAASNDGLYQLIAKSQYNIYNKTVNLSWLKICREQALLNSRTKNQAIEVKSHVKQENKEDIIKTLNSIKEKRRLGMWLTHNDYDVLLHNFISQGDGQNALAVLDEMKGLRRPLKPSAGMYKAVILFYDSQKNREMVLTLSDRMKQAEIQPDQETLAIVNQANQTDDGWVVMY